MKETRAAAIAVAGALGVAAVAVARSTGWFASLGGKMSGERLRRAERSVRWRAGRFHNSVPTRTIVPGGFRTMLRAQMFARQVRRPPRPIPAERRTGHDYDTPPPSGLRATWVGHASVLLELDGLRVVTDPVWSERASPSWLAGPKRFFAPPIALAELPPIDAAVISHDHYDHLDMATARELGARGTLFFAPLGVGSHLEKWGIPAARIRELDWGEHALLEGVRFIAAPSRHFSGRGISNRLSTLWSSWILAGPRHRVFFCGDSGYFGGFCEIGREHGPFDLTLVSVGAYSAAWPSIHMTPEEAAQAHVDVRGELLLPIHWGTFRLAPHGWNEPASRVSLAAAQRGARIVVPRPGQMVEPSRAADLPVLEWWRES